VWPIARVVEGRDFVALFRDDIDLNALVHKRIMTEDIPNSNQDLDPLVEFNERDFHPEITLNSKCKKLYLEENYLEAAFEACKIYEKKVLLKTKLKKGFGIDLMNKARSESGLLKTKNTPQLIVHPLSIKITKEARNSGGHEPSKDWPVSQKGCLHILGQVMILLIELEKAVYVEKITRPI
jgi:hypothetical protein